MEYPSLRVVPTQKTSFEATGKAKAPTEPDCLRQIAYIHPLKDSEENFDNHQFKQSMSMLRRHEGLAAPLKMNMELFSARKVGHLPFLPSSNLMEDILLGNDDIITFSDFLGTREFSEEMSQPHAVMEKRYKF